MRKYILLSCIAVCVFCSTAFSFAEGGQYYVGVQAGVSIPKDIKLAHAKLFFYPPSHSNTNVITVGKKSLGISPMFEAMCGFRLSSKVAVELEFSYATQYKFSHSMPATFQPVGKPSESLMSYYSTRLKSQALVLNMKYYIFGNSTWSPYLLLGAGPAWNTVKGTHFRQFNYVQQRWMNELETHKRTSDFAWQVGIGSTFNVYKNIKINLAYKYRYSGRIRSMIDTREDAAIRQLIRDSLKSSNISFGIICAL